MALDNLVVRLRYVINDLDDATRFDDIQLKNFLAIGAINVVEELSEYGIQSYDITFPGVLAEPTITPDPTGMVEGNLIVLQAAKIITTAEARKMSATAGFKIVDDRSSIDSKDVGKNLIAIKQIVCEEYDAAADAFKYNRRYDGGAVFGAYAGPSGGFVPLPGSRRGF